MLVGNRIAINAAISLGALLSLFSIISVPQEASAQLPGGGCGRVSQPFWKDPCGKVRRRPVNVDYDYYDDYEDVPPMRCGLDDEPVGPIRSFSPISSRHQRAYTYAPAKKQEWHQGLTNDEVRAKTIWSGADRNDRKMQAQIIEKQLRECFALWSSDPP